ncbi:ATP-binding cassette, subfamily C [Novosphingobium sp. CF614]|uniref:type I secretion system permease/ATPase n=1 Tax=Novosphingobium sp. CF614 TaxID=1884364 RepID=UPI0008EB137E|nr:type I secretion system permease/ATPase [Novosphingobium sp. CF614]SFG07871.1 ATP-binding cassette, subfamily C [Novosphingobium sp. CF614]
MTSELQGAVGRFRAGIGAVVTLSAMINVLALSSSIYLMLVYDRVLPGQQLATLLTLFAIVAIAYLFSGLFEALRAHLLLDIGAAFDRVMTPRVQAVEMARVLRQPEHGASAIRDLDQIRAFATGTGPAALIDMPWVAIYLAVLSLIDIWLGVVTLAGGIVLALLTWRAERVTKGRAKALAQAANARRLAADRQMRHAELIEGLGIGARIGEAWTQVHVRFLDMQGELNEKIAQLSTVSRVFRVFLQSSVLTVGAILVIDGKASGGIIFASSIIAGRALAPIDQAISAWRPFVAARESWARLNRMLAETPVQASPAVVLPLPTERIAAEGLTLMPPGSERIVVMEASFAASAGEAVAILGPSAAGKSALLRGLIGVWPPARGTVRLDGALIDQWDRAVIGAAIGYLPQSVELLGGTIAENIARMDPDAPSETVIAAARAAGVHDMILQFPQGYATSVGENGVHLSAGQRQRIALARALYGDPFLLALDEPNANLDPDGERALARAILDARQRGAIVIVAAHRTSVLQAVSHVLVMGEGRIKGFGARDEMVTRLTQPSATSTLTVVPGGNA